MKHKLTQVGVSVLLAVGGLFVAATAASAHANAVTGVATCVSTPGAAHYNIVWTVANDWNLTETATVTAATGGLTTVTGTGGAQPPYVDIAASPNTSHEATGTFNQVLPTTVSGSTASLTVTGLWSDNYSGSATGTAELPKGCVPAPLPLVITASSPTKVYGAAVPAVTASYSGFVNGDTAASLTTQPTCTTTATASSPVGNYPTSCSGAVDANYTITYVPGTLTVTPVPLTITASSPTMSYGGSVPAITASYSGFVNGDTSAKLTTAPTCSTTAKSSSPVGTYPTTCSGAVDANYTITYVPGKLTVVQGPVLIITASNATMVAGSTVPAITASYSGFVNGDTPASLTTLPTCSTTATSASAAGNYPTNCTGAVDANYTITYVPGTLTVMAPAISVPGVITSANPVVTPTVASTHQKKHKKAVAAPLAKPTAIAAATTIHTGEPWAGTQGLEEGIALLGLALIGLGELRRRHNKGRRLMRNS